MSNNLLDLNAKLFEQMDKLSKEDISSEVLFQFIIYFLIKLILKILKKKVFLKNQKKKQQEANL